jgi:hypothetical protein
MVKTVVYQISTSYKNPMGVENNLNYKYDVFVSHLSPFLFYCQESWSGPIFILIPKKIKTLPSSSSQSQPSSLTESENDDGDILCFLPMGEISMKLLKLQRNYSHAMTMTRMQRPLIIGVRLVSSAFRRMNSWWMCCLAAVSENKNFQAVKVMN